MSFLYREACSRFGAGAFIDEGIGDDEDDGLLRSMFYLLAGAGLAFGGNGYH